MKWQVFAASQEKYDILDFARLPMAINSSSLNEPEKQKNDVTREAMTRKQNVVPKIKNGGSALYRAVLKKFNAGNEGNNWAEAYSLMS